MAKRLLSVAVFADQEVHVDKNITSIACIISQVARLDCAEQELSYLRL